MATSSSPPTGLGTKKSVFVLITVVGCIAILWPKILYFAMFGGQTNNKAFIKDHRSGTAFRGILLAKDDEVAKKKAVDHVMEVSTPRFLGRFNKLLQEGDDSGFLVGNTISLADIFVYNILVTVAGFGLNVTKNYPELERFVQKIGNIQQIKDWVDKRPVTLF